jgi:hypothetical protein
VTVGSKFQQTVASAEGVELVIGRLLSSGKVNQRLIQTGPVRIG